MKRVSAILAVATFVAAASPAYASVWLQNKDGRTATVTVHRSNSHMDVEINGKSKMELPDAPLTVEWKKQKIEAKDDDTVVIEKGKLTLVPGDNGEDSDSGSTDAATPAPTDTPAPAPDKK